MRGRFGFASSALEIDCDASNRRSAACRTGVRRAHKTFPPVSEAMSQSARSSFLTLADEMGAVAFSVSKSNDARTDAASRNRHKSSELFQSCLIGCCRSRSRNGIGSLMSSALNQLRGFTDGHVQQKLIVGRIRIFVLVLLPTLIDGVDILLELRLGGIVAIPVPVELREKRFDLRFDDRSDRLLELE